MKSLVMRIVCILLTLSVMTGCQQDPTAPSKPPTITVIQTVIIPPGTGSTNNPGVPTATCPNGVKVTVSPHNNLTGPKGTTGNYSASVNCGDSDGAWTSSDQTVATVNSNGNVTIIGVGQASVCYVLRYTLAGVAIYDCIQVFGTGTVVTPTTGTTTTINLTVCGVGYNGTTTYQIHTVRGGVEVQNTQVDYFVDSNQISVSNSGLITPVAVGTHRVRAAPKSAPNDMDTYNVVVTNTACTAVIIPPGNNVTGLSVTPKRLDLLIGQGGNLNALATVSSGTAPVPVWSSTRGCVNVANGASGATLSVTGTRVCTDSIVAQVGNYKDYSIVTVTSGVTSCTYASDTGTYTRAPNQTANITTTCTGSGPFNPFYFSRNTVVAGVVGAPSTVVVQGFPFPAGMTATVKFYGLGSADICVQAAVQDPTIFFCRTWTVTASGSLFALQSADSPQLFSASEGRYVKIPLSEIPQQPAFQIIR